jgi:hypothetical protein
MRKVCGAARLRRPLAPHRRALNPRRRDYDAQTPRRNSGAAAPQAAVAAHDVSGAHPPADRTLPLDLEMRAFCMNTGERNFIPDAWAMQSPALPLARMSSFMRAFELAAALLAVAPGSPRL